MSGVRIPAEMQPEFERFRRDFDAAWRRWMDEGSETPEAFAQAKRDVSAWMASIQADPAQDQRLREVFAYWRRVAAGDVPMRGNTVAVRPVPVSVEMHSRWIDRDCAREARRKEQMTDTPQEHTPC